MVGAENLKDSLYREAKQTLHKKMRVHGLTEEHDLAGTNTETVESGQLTQTGGTDKMIHYYGGSFASAS